MKRSMAVPIAVAALAGSLACTAVAQQKTISDAQVEANVLRALATAPELSTQDIRSTTVYGVVTLSGSAADEASRTRAENLVARADGVKKVVDELTIAGETASSAPPQPMEQPPQQAGNQPSSAGTPDPSMQPGNQEYSDPDPAARNQAAEDEQPASTTAQNNTPYTPAPQQPSDNRAGNAQQAPPPQPEGTYAPPQSQRADGGYSGAPPSNQGQYPQYPPQYPQRYPQQQQQRRRYNAPYAQQVPGGQEAGRQVTIASGALVRVRINQGLSTTNAQPGTSFEGTVLNDVIADGAIAIPRGASVQGTVIDVETAGALSGRGELSLQLTRLNLGGQSYPLTSDIWMRNGSDKSTRTVNSALGLGAVGAIIGGVAGGGPGAAIGAGVGGAAGVASSAASPSGQVILPPEAVLTFHLTQPVTVATVSEAEMSRLAYNAGPGAPGQPPVLRRRPYGYPGPYYGPYGPYPPYGPYGPYPYGPYPYRRY